jgi:non-heme Fe2+,alpha-ketoglutarate-dependent halogenase|tara:strand:+ start:1125 stop:1286 length:162 start_codon:yes stop_codon:yes gene_type:complete
MSKLSSNQLQEYNNNGYVALIDILTKDEAFEIRKEIENIENKWLDELKVSPTH